MAWTREDVARKPDDGILAMIKVALKIREGGAVMPDHLAEQEIWAYEEAIKRDLNVDVPAYIMAALSMNAVKPAPPASPEPSFKLTLPKD